MPDRIEVRAVRNGGRDFIEVPTRDEALIAALQRERAGYVARGLPARVAAVDAELARLDVDPPATETSEPMKGATDDGEGRRTRRAGGKPAGRRAAAERE